MLEPPAGNEPVLSYLEVERIAPPGTNTPWVIDGYSLSTHLQPLPVAAGLAAILSAFVFAERTLWPSS